MPDAIGVASIEIVPDTTAFLPRTQAQVSTALAKVKADVEVQAIVSTGTGSAAAAAAGASAAQAASGFSALESTVKAAKAASLDSTKTLEQHRAALDADAGASVEESAALKELIAANAEYEAALRGQLALTDKDIVSRAEQARAAEAASAAEHALAAVTSETDGVTAKAIETAALYTRSLDRQAAAAAAAAEAGALGALKASETSKSIGAGALALTGFSGELTVAAVAAFALFQSLQERSNFVDQMHIIQSATHASAEEMKQAEKIAIDYGHSLEIPAATAFDASQAIADLTHKGFDLADSEALAKTALLESAAATEDVGSAVDDTTNLVLAYHLAVQDAIDATDALTASEIAGVGSTKEVADALAELGPQAHTLGLGIRDVSTFLIQLGNDGVSAGDATSQLRVIFSAITKDSKQFQEGLKRAGVSLRELEDAQGNLRPDAFVKLGEAVNKLDSTTRRQVISQLFGRAARTADILLRQEAQGFEVASERAQEHGVTLEEAETSAKGLGGQIRELHNDLSDLGQVTGQITSGPATAFIGILDNMAQALTTDALGVEALIHGFTHLGDANRAETERTQSESDRRNREIAEKGKHIFASLYKDYLTFAVSPILLGSAAIVDHFVKAGDDSKNVWDEADKAITASLSDIRDNLDATGDAAEIMAGRFSAATDLAIQQATGASLATQLATAREARQNALLRLARDRRRLSEDPNAFGPGNAQARLQADAAAVEKARGDVNRILGQMAGKRRDQASAAKDAADKVIQANNDHDQAVIDALSSEETRRSANIAHFAAVGATNAQIKADKELRDFYAAAIRRVQHEIHDAKVKAAEIQDLRIARQKVIDEINALEKQAAKDAQEAAKNASEAAVESASLSEQILETRFGSDPNARQRRQLIAAHKKVIAALKEEQALVGRRTVEWKRLQLQIEQERAAIRDLQKKENEKNTAIANLQKQEFSFLQTIHGFDANLIGNLIPGGITGGLVGGTADASSLPGGAATASTTAFGGPRTADEHGRGRGARSTTTSSRPVSAGQGNTQITLLREIRNILLRQGRASDHPEVHHQRAKGASAMDFHIQGTIGM